MSVALTAKGTSLQHHPVLLDQFNLQLLYAKRLTSEILELLGDEGPRTGAPEFPLLADRALSLMLTD